MKGLNFPRYLLFNKTLEGVVWGCCLFAWSFPPVQVALGVNPSTSECEEAGL